MNDFQYLNQAVFDLPEEITSYTVDENEPVIDDRQPLSRAELAEDVKLVWTHRARENFDRTNNSESTHKFVSDALAQERLRKIVQSLTTLKAVLAKLRDENTDTSNFIRDPAQRSDVKKQALIRLLRDGLRSALFGSRLSIEIEKTGIDPRDISDDELRYFLKIKVGMIFGALADRLRYEGLKETRVASNKGFLPDFVFLLNSRIPVSTDAAKPFTQLLFDEIQDTSRDFSVSGGWGSIQVRSDGLYLVIDRDRPQELRRSTAKVKTKVY